MAARELNKAVAMQDHERSLLALAESSHAREQRRHLLRMLSLRGAVVATVIALWWLASGRLIDRLFVSDPMSVVLAFLKIVEDGTLWWHIELTLLEMTLGYIAGVAAGVGLAILVAPIPYGAQILRPLMLGIFAIPKVALAPLIIVWFGIYLLPKIILAASLVFFIVYFSTLAGFASVSQDLVAAVRVMGVSRASLFLKLILPSATPYIMSAMRITLPGALIGAIIGEFVSSNRGIGFLIAHASSRYDTAQVFAAIASLVAFVLLLSALVSRVERFLLRWRQDPAKRNFA